MRITAVSEDDERDLRKVIIIEAFAVSLPMMFLGGRSVDTHCVVIPFCQYLRSFPTASIVRDTCIWIVLEEFLYLPELATDAVRENKLSNGMLVRNRSPTRNAVQPPVNENTYVSMNANWLR